MEVMQSITKYNNEYYISTFLYFRISHKWIKTRCLVASFLYVLMSK